MAIHHSQAKKAEKAGYTLSDEGGEFRAFWPKRGLAIYGVSVADAMQQMQAAQAICDLGDIFRIRLDPTNKRMVRVVEERDLSLVGCPTTPFEALAIMKKQEGRCEWEEWHDIQDIESTTTNMDGDELPADILAAERINGVSINGAVAFREGTPAGDCPYSSEEEDGDEYENFIRWNDEWDAAADAAEVEDDGKTGSVVSAKYRAKYAEAGHPTHCGDWLAETLNELCLNKEGVNLELFEAICLLNGVDTSKYKREGVGWQGRIRMTGRNMMARRVYVNEGKLILPDTLGGFKQAPDYWMEQQRYKSAKAPEQPAATVATITVKTAA